MEHKLEPWLQIVGIYGNPSYFPDPSSWTRWFELWAEGCWPCWRAVGLSVHCCFGFQSGS